MLNFIKSSLKYFIVGILALIPVVIVMQVLVFLKTILRGFFIYIYTYRFLKVEGVNYEY